MILGGVAALGAVTLATTALIAQAPVAIFDPTLVQQLKPGGLGPAMPAPPQSVPPPPLSREQLVNAARKLSGTVAIDVGAPVHIGPDMMWTSAGDHLDVSWPVFQGPAADKVSDASTIFLFYRQLVDQTLYLVDCKLSSARGLSVTSFSVGSGTAVVQGGHAVFAFRPVGATQVELALKPYAFAQGDPTFWGCDRIPVRLLR